MKVPYNILYKSHGNSTEPLYIIYNNPLMGLQISANGDASTEIRYCNFDIMDKETFCTALYNKYVIQQLKWFKSYKFNPTTFCECLNEGKMNILLYKHTGEYNKFDEEKFDRKDFTVDNINFTDDELSEFYDGTVFNDYKSYTEYYSNLKNSKNKR